MTTPSTNIIRQNMQIIKHYVCAVCWGQLVARDGEPICAKYGDEHRGFVTRYYAEKRRKESALDRANASWNLRQYIIREKRSEEEILRELGFGG